MIMKNVDIQSISFFVNIQCERIHQNSIHGRAWCNACFLGTIKLLFIFIK